MSAMPQREVCPLTVLVTGAAGFIGSHVAEALLKRGDNVLIMDSLRRGEHEYYPKDERTEYVYSRKAWNLEVLMATPGKRGTGSLTKQNGYVESHKFLEGVVRGRRPDVICHFAARTNVAHSIENPKFFIDGNITGTTHVLEAAGGNECVQAVVFASSSSVYGAEATRESFRESDDSGHPVSPYAVTKRAAEMMCHTYSLMHGFPVDILRFFTVYGPRGRPDMAPYTFVRAIDSGGQIEREPKPGELLSHNYTYIDDAVQAVLASMDRHLKFDANGRVVRQRRTPGMSYCTTMNIAHERVPFRDLIALIEELLGKEATLDGHFHSSDILHAEVDISVARAILGYNPTTTIEEGMRKFVDWYLEVARGSEENK